MALCDMAKIESIVEMQAQWQMALSSICIHPVQEGERASERTST